MALDTVETKQSKQQSKLGQQQAMDNAFEDASVIELNRKHAAQLKELDMRQPDESDPEYTEWRKLVDEAHLAFERDWDRVIAPVYKKCYTALLSRR
jgi:hypothetical protein